MYATTYAPAAVPMERQAPNIDWIGSVYTPVARALRAVTAIRPAAPSPAIAAEIAAVRDLLDAAGPLTMADIAGGLDITVKAASARVAALLYCGCLRPDEWGRFRVTEGCRD